VKLYARILFAFLLAVVVGVSRTQACAQTDPLASWNDGAAKSAINEFVHATTDQSSQKFVPREEPIAAFDQDGTLWVEHPIYTQVIYCLDRVPAIVKEKSELGQVEPFKTVMSGDRDAMAKLSMEDLLKIVAATSTGITVGQMTRGARVIKINWGTTPRADRRRECSNSAGAGIYV